MKKTKITPQIKPNVTLMEDAFKDCADLKKKPMKLGVNQDVEAYLIYVEVAVKTGTSVLGQTLRFLNGKNRQEILSYLNNNALAIPDATFFATIEEAVDGVLTGETILFVDGFDKALKIPDGGYPAMGISETDSEKVVRGSNEGLSESVKQNAALIRRRIRSPKVKARQLKIGVRSNTNVYVMYIEDLAQPALVKEIEERLQSFEVDGVLDTGILEQLSERDWFSPFPQFQSTERVDRASMALLEGRVVVLSDNSPVGLILPTDYNSFIKTSDDYYNRWEIATFTRMIRYVASFFALTLPGFYLVATNFHTQLLPTSLLLSFADARAGVPFPAVLEVVLMELAFELLREAGVRIPGSIGSTIGIVGGLIIGQAAVEANLVSPIVVIVVAFTALCSFAVPNAELGAAFRLLKFVLIGLSAWLGYFGMLAGLLGILIHLSHLNSFGNPYLAPFVGADLNHYEDERDVLWRAPLRCLRKRPIYANEKERTKLVFKAEEKDDVCKK